ncbi:MAG: peptidyl-prolyl cis-trans isomerase SurA [Moraxellaceae bacterium]|jgi:peptidyl-prolyl cis-trans isomerase SurA|nr:peptidyl-prolyl cis-trans isomerase SurA [Moraxellaceae bacterium]
MRIPALLFLLSTSLLARADVLPLDKVAVVVDDSVILQSEIAKRLEDIRFQFGQRGAALPPEEVLRKQVVEQLILENLQLNLATRAGIRIDDKEVTASLEEIARQNGMGLAAFQQQLDTTPGGSYAEVREQVKRELVITRLRTRRMQDRIRITDQDVQNFLRSPGGQAELATEYRLGHILVALPEEATPKDIAAAEARVQKAQAELAAGKDFAQVAATWSAAETALKGGDLGWRKAAQLPELFVASAGKLKVNEVAGPFRTPGGLHLIKLVGKRGVDDVKVPQWQVRHILIKPNEILPSEDARQKLEDIRARLQKGASFAELARTYSEDPGSARQGGDLGWVSPGDMVSEFDAMMRKTPVDQVSDIFQSSFGWHILTVTGTREQDMSDRYRTNIARQALYAREYDDELASWLRELRNDAFVEVRTP